MFRLTSFYFFIKPLFLDSLTAYTLIPANPPDTASTAANKPTGALSPVFVLLSDTSAFPESHIL